MAAGRPASQPSALPSRARTGCGQLSPRRGQMFHQAEKERQVRLVHALLVEREDEGAFLRAQQIVGVFDALGDALQREHGAEIVGGQKLRQILVRDFGIDGHGLLRRSGRREA